MTVNNIHNIVFFHRKKANLNRKQLADLAGVGKTSIYDLEKGKKTLRWSTIMAVLKALNIKIIFKSPLMAQYEESRGSDA
jgi:DNA-binding XRE family transcriptional regulator